MGEVRGNLSGERFPLTSPKPPPLSLPRLSTGGEAARREFFFASKRPEWIRESVPAFSFLEREEHCRDEGG